jgi:AcrR family transcriptional regulator
MLPVSPARARNAAATRAAILDAARNRFVRESYDTVGLREVAADVGVDAALVSRYFGSKEDLFNEVLASTGDASELFRGDVGQFGRRVAELIVYDPPKDAKLDGLLIMLRSSASPKAADVVRRRMDQEFYSPFAQWAGGEDARIRVRLAGALIMGMTLSRALTEDFGLTAAEREGLVSRLAALLQSCVDAPPA